MAITKAMSGTFCDHCKMEYGHFDNKTSIWSFRNVDAQAHWTITSEMSRSNGVVRHYCRYHMAKMQEWPPAKPTGIWPLEEQLAYGAQLEMAAANV